MPPDRSREDAFSRRVRAMTGRPVRSAAVLAAVWGLPGLLVLPLLGAGGAAAHVLWGVGATVLLTFAVLSAVFGLFVPRWWTYTAASLGAYLLLAAAYAAVVLGLGGDAAGELGTFAPMYTAFGASFVLVCGVTGLVRRIAGYAGLHEAEG